MKRANTWGLALILAASAPPALAQAVVPHACDVTTVTTGSTAVTPIGVPPATGYTIANPVTAAEQGIVTAESLYVDISGAAATILGVGTTIEMLPGQAFPGVGQSTKTVSVNAATSGHKFSCVRW